MANPRYPQRQERISPRERRLGELGALTQIAGNPLDRQALAQREQQNRVAAVIQLMQLMGEQRQGQERLAQQGQGLDIQRQDLGLRQQELAQKGQEVAGRGDANQLNVLGALAERGDPAAVRALQQLIPSLGQANTAMQGEATAKGVAGMMPAIQALYKENNNLPQQLAGLEPSVPPQVWNAIPWDSLNQGMAQPQATEGPTGLAALMAPLNKNRLATGAAGLGAKLGGAIGQALPQQAPPGPIPPFMSFLTRFMQQPK